MKPAHLAKLTGLSIDDLTRDREIVAFLERGRGPEQMCTASDVETAMATVTALMFEHGAPAYDEGFGPDGSYGSSSAKDQALAYELSVAQQIARTHDPKTLVYLAGILADESLRLVVAWEAAAPAPDFALGIFETVPVETKRRTGSATDS